MARIRFARIRGLIIHETVFEINYGTKDIEIHDLKP